MIDRSDGLIHDIGEVPFDHMQLRWRVLFLFNLLPLTVWAQTPAGGNIGVQQGIVVRQALDAATREPAIPPGLHETVSAGATDVSSSDFDEVGQVSVDRCSAGVGMEMVMTNGLMLGGLFDHERSRYDFSDDSVASGVGVDDVTANRFGVNARGRLNSKWSVFGNVDTTFNVEKGASWSKGQTAGGFLSFTRRVNDRFSFSISLMGHSRLEERPQVMPMPGIDWKITERLSLRTAQGLTLAWQMDEKNKWATEFSAGYESRSFRMDEDGSLPDGVVKDSQAPILATLRYRPSPGVGVRCFAGVVVARQFEFLDQDGHTADTVDADPAAIAGVSANFRF